MQNTIRKNDGEEKARFVNPGFDVYSDLCMSSLRNPLNQVEAQGKKHEELKGVVIDRMLYSVPQNLEIR